MKTNQDLQIDVQEALASEISLQPAEVGVAVRDGIVTLYGTVDCFYKKTAAGNSALNVKGVKAVVQNMSVAYEKSLNKSDTEVVISVISAIRDCPCLPDNAIKIRFENGTLTLEGELPWNYQKEAAKSAVNYLEGVRKVRNNILIKSDKDDAFEKNHLEAALAKNSVFSKNIVVGVSGSKLTLNGNVASTFEKQEVERIAKLTPGVWLVVNELTVASVYAQAIS